MPEEHEKFEVKDRRKALLDEEESVQEESKTENKVKGTAKEQPKEVPGGAGPSAGPGQLPPIDFIAFIGSLGASALMHLGEKLTPDQPDIDVNLPAAQQMIDILDMLKEKTEGNLKREEQASLDNLLYNLKMRFAQAANIR